MDEEYVKRIRELAVNVNKNNPQIDLFQVRVRGRAPTQAFSEFLTNREQGDWAEETVLKILKSNLKKFYSVSYGRTDSLIAGDNKFKEFYESYQDELDEIGKCPDILIFDDESVENELSKEIANKKPRKDLIEVVREARAGLEVRSSAFLVGQYISFMKSKGEDYKGRNFLSFTPKVEDLAVIIKWIEIHGVPHYYVQVLFDRIYIISFEKILEILSVPGNLKTKYYIEKNAKNQFKNTIHINLDEGECLTEKVILPKHKSAMKELGRGRILSYVSFLAEETKDIKQEDLLRIFNLG
jgi:hypothetical protein